VDEDLPFFFDDDEVALADWVPESGACPPAVGPSSFTGTLFSDSAVRTPLDSVTRDERLLFDPVSGGAVDEVPVFDADNGMEDLVSDAAVAINVVKSASGQQSNYKSKRISS
jgi:hypothetical protein